MSYIRTHNIAKTLLAILIGAPFVIGVFSNTRPVMPTNDWQPNAQQQEQPPQQQPEPIQETLFGHLNLTGSRA